MYPFIDGNDTQYFLRALIRTNAAAYAGAGIYHRQPVCSDVDRIKRTGPLTGAQTDTAETAIAWAAKLGYRQMAVKNPLILIFGLGILKGTVAVQLSYLADRLTAGFFPHDPAHLSGYGGLAGHTGIYRRIRIYYCISIAGTSRDSRRHRS